MVKMAERKTSPRTIYMKLLGRDVEGAQLADVRRADALVDESLTLLDDDEPTLRGWLRDDSEINELLRVHTSATFALLQRNGQRGMPLEHTMHQIDSLNYRLICTVALAAAMRERPSATDWSWADGWGTE